MENIIPVDKKGSVTALPTDQLINILEIATIQLKEINKTDDWDYSGKIEMYENTLNYLNS